jgi:hypothetical protein
VLSVTLQDVLTECDDAQSLKWALIWIEAIGDLGRQSMLDFEKDVNESTNGLQLEWEELVRLSTKFEQVIELILVGSKSDANLKRFASQEEMYSACDYTIELVDSSYWLIHALDEKAIKHLKETLPGAEYVNE